jgi:hypothetical protein
MKNMYKILLEALKGGEHLGDQGIGGRITLKLILKGIESDDVDWFHMAEVRVKWWASVNAVVNLGVPYKADNFLIKAGTLCF